MQLLKLIDIDLIYSNIEENEASSWDNTTIYNKGDLVIVTDKTPHKIYESLIDNNQNYYPPDYVWQDKESAYSEWDRKTVYAQGDRVKVSYEEDGITELDVPQAFISLTDNNQGNYPPNDITNWQSLDYWKDLGATNRWAMFDEYVLTQTIDTNKIEIVISFPNCNGFALFGLYAKSIEWYLYDGDYTNPDNLVVSGSIDNLEEPVSNWYEYFFEEISWKQDVFIGDLPKYANGQLKVIINPFDIVKCGLFTCGKARHFGETLFGSRLGIIDFSKKEVDNKGNATLEQGNFVKEVECDIWIYTKALDIIRKELASVRATPTVFSFNNKNISFDSLIVYGFYKDFDILLSNPMYSKCSIRVEGLI